MTRERVCVQVIGESVDIEISAEARAHLVRSAESHGLPSLSALVQALALCAAYPLTPREAAAKARMPYARWLPAVVLSATEYSALGHQIARAADALKAPCER